MENIYFDVVISEMSSFLEQNGFKEKEGYFANDTKALKVEYDEERFIYKLLIADITEAGVGEYALVSSYLFDEGQTKKDAACVGIDFVDEAKKTLGIKEAKKRISVSELPSANSNTVNTDVLTAKLLANYPDLKDTYKDYVNQKGKYLPLDFGTTYFVPEIRKTLDENNKKAVKKLMDVFADVFVAGDRASVNLVIALLASAIGKNADRFKAAADRLEDCTLLIDAVNQEIMLATKDRKLQKAIKFEV